jgi:S1-C subfamily serine protease
MMRTGFLIGAWLVAGGVTAQAAEPAEIDRWLDAVVMVVAGPAYCSGVLIDDAGTVATAYHCVANVLRPQIRTRSGERFRGRTVATSARDDLAVLSVPELAGRVALPVRVEPARVGQTVWAMGHPFAPSAEGAALFEGLLQWSVTRGIVSQVGNRLIQVDAAINPGNSGGPIVDDSGEIVGIASRKLRAENIGFISPAEKLLALLEAPKGPQLIGGMWGGHLTGLQVAQAGQVSTLGALGVVELRDRLIGRVGVHQAIGAADQALALRRAHWLAQEATVSVRGRVGTGKYSVSAEIGGGAVVVATIEEDDQEDLLPTAFRPAPAVVLRLGFRGLGLRWLSVSDEQQRSLFLAMDFEFPGLIRMF